MLDETIKKINFYFFNIGLFSFLFLWDLKFQTIQLRFLILLPLIFLLFDKKIYNIKNNLIIFVTPLFITIHLLIISYLENYILDKRDIFGIIFLFTIFFITIYNYENFKKSLSVVIDTFTIFFSIFYIVYLFYSKSAVSPDCYDGWFFRTKFIFVENSHFALISIPIINYYTYFFCKLKKIEIKYLTKFIFFVIFLIISYINFSTTFLVGLIATQFYFILKNYRDKKIIIISLIYILISSLTILNYKQCSIRSIESIKHISEILKFKNLTISENYDDKIEKFLNKQSQLGKDRIAVSMSVETFIVSLEITLKSIIDNPFGVGFNKYHLAHKKYIDQIFKLDNSIKKNNIYDGSTNLSKIPTEFGVFGLAIILIFVFFCLYRKNLNEHDYFIISLISLQFLRGVGYFNAGLIMFFIIFFYNINYVNKNN